jgi:DNA-binding CsgD family transcriptional regulator
MVALTFALRRLRADRVLALVTTRVDEADRLPAGLLRLAESQDGRIHVAGLDEEEIVAFGAELGHANLARRSAARLRDHTEGNPLYLRALLSELPLDAIDAVGPLPAPHSYRLLVLGSVASHSPAAQRLARAAAVLPEGSPLSTTASLAHVGNAEEALDELVKAHVLTCVYADEGWLVSFAHPLVRAAVYDDLGPMDRHRLHRHAATLCDGDAALSHRVAAASGPDPVLSAEIADRAGELRAAGDIRAAADCFSKAGRLAGPQGSGLLLEAANLFLIAGDVTAAKAADESILGEVADATRVYLRARIAWFSGQPGEAAELAAHAWERAAELDTGGRAWLAAILAQLHNMEGDGTGAAEWADRALAEELPPDLADSTAAARAIGLVIAGQSAAALDALEGLPSDPELFGPDRSHQLTARGALRALADDLEGARGDLEVLDRTTPDLAPQRLLGLGVLAEVEYRLGRWDSSLAIAEQAISLAEDSEQRWVQGYLHAAAVLVSAGRGLWSRADEHLEAARTLAEQLGDPATWAVCENVGVHIASCRDDPQGVVDRAELLVALVGAPTEEPGWLSWPVLYTSALVQLGRFDEAEDALERFGSVARQRGSRSRRAALARVQGELATARREHARARSAFEEALQLGDASDALEQARVRASYGRFLRRRGERRAARLQLETASGRFLRLGAAPFLSACNEELAACGVSAVPSATDESDRLTPQERLVVRLVCEGLTNQEVARQLVLSTKTVGYHLGNAYTKLGVRSRTQLVAKLGPST